mgnify:FL=1
MTIAAHLLSPWLCLALWLCLGATCAIAAWYADWRALRAVPSRYHLFFGSVVCSLALWLISVNAIEGFWLHFLGVTTLTLLLGWRLAVLAGTAAIIIHTLLIGQALAAAAPAWLLTVAIPAPISRWLVHRLRRSQARNLIIYMLGAGFGGGMLSVLGMAAGAVMLLWVSGQTELVTAALDNWPMIFLMLFPEGFINGMVVTTLTVFYPNLVKTFDDAYYLEND